jgi:hypothetical protein
MKHSWAADFGKSKRPTTVLKGRHVMSDTSTHDVSAREPSIPGNTTTKADLFSRAKDAIEAGDQSLHDAAEALALAREDFKASQREIADAVGKSVAWVNRLLQWRKQGFVGTPFGPGSRARRERQKSVQAPEQATDGVDADKAEASAEKGTTESSEQGADPKSQERDIALNDFTARILDLITRTDKRPPERFSATAVPAGDLAKLGKFLTEIANVKKVSDRRAVTDHRSKGDGT